MSQTLRFEGNKIYYFPRDQSLRDWLYIYIAGNFEAGNLLNLAVNGGPRSTFAGNSALLRCDFIEFAMLPAQRFWRKTVSLLDVMGARSNQ